MLASNLIRGLSRSYAMGALACTATWNGNVATLAFGAAHGVPIGDSQDEVAITGMSVAGYNTPSVLVTATDSTHLTYYAGNTPLAAGTGGTATFLTSPGVIDVSGLNTPFTVTAIPASGNTVKVEYSTTPYAEDNVATANWLPWPSGTVAAAASNTLYSPITALRFTRVTGAGNNDVFEVAS